MSAVRKDKIAPLARSQLIAAALLQLIALRELDSGQCAPLECADEVVVALRESTRARGESMSSPGETA